MEDDVRGDNPLMKAIREKEKKYEMGITRAIEVISSKESSERNAFLEMCEGAVEGGIKWMGEWLSR
jgi:hypothetical protein